MGNQPTWQTNLNYSVFVQSQSVVGTSDVRRCSTPLHAGFLFDCDAFQFRTESTVKRSTSCCTADYFIMFSCVLFLIVWPCYLPNLIQVRCGFTVVDHCFAFSFSPVSGASISRVFDEAGTSRSRVHITVVLCNM